MAALLTVALAMVVMLLVGTAGASAVSNAAPGTGSYGLVARETETEHPRETETAHPRETETEHSRETETEHPRETETAHPEATRTEHPRETETEHPRETDTARPAATGTTVAGGLIPGSGSRTFPETGKAVSGIFLQYWDQNGALAQQGFPISAMIQERSDLNGKTYAVQYFERAVFEYHAENQAPFNVLLSQLGTFRYNAKYPSGAAGQRVSTDNAIKFAETGKSLGGKFRSYWESHGGLAQQGYPISDEFQEKSDLDGKTYTVQYFERAVFEMHPENQAPFDVLLSQLGTFQYKQKYGK